MSYNADSLGYVLGYDRDHLVHKYTSQAACDLGLILGAPLCSYTNH